MTLTRRIGFGVTLGCDPAGGTSFAVLGAIVDAIDGADAKTDEVDASLLTEKYKAKAGAQIDAGKVTYTIAYDPKDTSTTTVLTGLLTSSANANWQISYPVINAETQQTDSFLGYVSGFKRSIQKQKMITADVEITLSNLNASNAYTKSVGLTGA